MNLLFWQPKIDYYSLFASHRYGRYLLVSSNYFIWFFLFYISYLLIKSDTNVFWQLLVATVAGELIEKILKLKKFWTRPAFSRNHLVPNGLIKSWYLTGSFPSGHTIKAIFFLLFLFQYPVFSPLVYVAVVAPLVSFRVITGFHYPADVLGGGLLGIAIWYLSQGIIFPESATAPIRLIFNFVFLIK